ncbi:MAG: division/cell wall cluster transcriptional repressor MraZ [Chloroflexi bacterium]|nr:division/cell wall cluster transcriptional repressor MraZ [Chloroflexota bacterium]
MTAGSERFLGEFEHRVDEKGRVPVPPRFRDSLKDGVVLTPGAERCIVAYPLAEWDRIAAALTSGTVGSSKLRRLNRALFATAFSLALDRQSRVMLPAPLRDYAGIRDEVVIAGANTYLELWNTELWQVEKASSQEHVWQIIESLERR